MGIQPQRLADTPNIKSRKTKTAGHIPTTMIFPIDMKESKQLLFSKSQTQNQNQSVHHIPIHTFTTLTILTPMPVSHVACSSRSRAGPDPQQVALQPCVL